MVYIVLVALTVSFHLVSFFCFFVCVLLCIMTSSIPTFPSLAISVVIHVANSYISIATSDSWELHKELQFCSKRSFPGLAQKILLPPKDLNIYVSYRGV